MLSNFHNEMMLTLIKIFSSGIVLFLIVLGSFQMYTNWDMQKNMQPGPFIDDGFCNVVTIPISGNIGIGATSATVDEAGQTVYNIPLTGDIDRVINDLEYVKNFPAIEAVILQVDSYGGYGNASAILLSYLKTYPKPVISLIRDAGTSMGYAVTLGTKRIFAYPGATVGSIGVNSSYLSSVGKNKKEGIEYISVVSGKYKDLGDANKELTEEDLNFLKIENQKYFDLFINEIAENRNLSRTDILKLADGKTWLADEAKNLGLIDEVGDKESALKWIEKYWNQEGKVALPCPMY